MSLGAHLSGVTPSRCLFKLMTRTSATENPACRLVSRRVYAGSEAAACSDVADGAACPVITPPDRSLSDGYAADAFSRSESLGCRRDGGSNAAIAAEVTYFGGYR